MNLLFMVTQSLSLYLPWHYCSKKGKYKCYTRKTGGYEVGALMNGVAKHKMRRGERAGDEKREGIHM